MELEVTEAAKKLLIAHGHQPEFGARPLRRTIQSELDNRIASLLLSGDAGPGDTIVADVENDSLHCTVRPGQAAEGGQEARNTRTPPSDLPVHRRRTPPHGGTMSHHKSNREVEGGTRTATTAAGCRGAPTRRNSRR